MYARVFTKKFIFFAYRLNSIPLYQNKYGIFYLFVVCTALEHVLGAIWLRAQNRHVYTFSLSSEQGGSVSAYSLSRKESGEFILGIIYYLKNEKACQYVTLHHEIETGDNDTMLGDSDNELYYR